MKSNQVQGGATHADLGSQHRSKRSEASLKRMKTQRSANFPENHKTFLPNVISARGTKQEIKRATGGRDQVSL